MEKKRSSAGYVAAIAILALLLVGGAVLYFQERDKNSGVQQILENEKQELTAELESLSEEYDNLKTTNDTLSYQLDVEKAKIKKMITELKQAKNSSFPKIRKYKNEVASLKALIQDYSLQVDSLNMLSMQLSEEKDLYKEEMEKKTAMADSLSVSNEELQKIVKRASVLEPMNLEVYPANRRNKPVRRLGWTRKLKVDFTFPKNITVEAGAKDVYVVITRPDDVTVSNPLGETFQYNEEPMIYTMKRTVYYENEVLPVSLFWENDKSLIEGQYKADIILEGEVIGSTNFIIK